MRDHETTGSARDERRIAPLNDLGDWELKDGEPDVRGWDVVSDTGARLGEVSELLAEPAARRVRYLDVELERPGDATDRHVALPIGTARIDEDARRVTLQSQTTRFDELPRYRGGAPERAYETRVASCFGCDERGLAGYEHPAYDDQAFYRR